MDGHELFSGAYELADEETRRFMRLIAPYMFEPTMKKHTRLDIANQRLDDLERIAKECVGPDIDPEIAELEIGDAARALREAIAELAKNQQ